MTEPEIFSPGATIGGYDKLFVAGPYVIYSTVPGSSGVVSINIVLLDGTTVGATSADIEDNLAANPRPNISCGFMPMIYNDQLTIVTQRVIHHPAEGVTAASYDIMFEAYDENFELLWTTPIVETVSRAPRCMEVRDTTTNQRWLMWGFWRDYSDYSVALVDLEQHTGAILGSEGAMSTVYSTTGDYVVKFGELPQEPDYAFLDPATLNQLGAANPEDIFLDQPSYTFVNFRESTEPLPDGSVIVAGSVLGGGSGFAARVAMPSGQLIQRLDSDAVTFDNVIYDPASGLIYASQELVETDETSFVAIDPATMTTRWSLPSGVICATSASAVAVGINGQIALIDVKTGEQITYTPNGKWCAETVGRYGISQANNTVQLIRLA